MVPAREWTARAATIKGAVMLEPLATPPLAADSPSESGYLLLETELIEQWLQSQPNVQGAPSLIDQLRRVDYACTRRWLWADTLFHQHQTRGPLLVQFQGASMLPHLFHEHWWRADGALMIRTTASIEQVLAHLRSILFIQMPDGNPVRFRLQETAALAMVIGALQPERAAMLLGPLEELYWCDNSSVPPQCWRFRKPEGPSFDEGFQLSAAELNSINSALDTRYLQRQVALTSQAPHGFTEDAQKQTQLWLEQLVLWGFSEPRHLDLALDALRHPEHAAHADHITRMLEESCRSPGARAAHALNYLKSQGS